MKATKANEGTVRETARARAAFTDYLSMGPDRSIDKLQRLYQVQSGNRGQSGAKAPPTVRLNTLKDWSSAFNWQGRLMAEQAAALEAQRARVRAEREAVFGVGLALDFRRAQVLEAEAERIIAALETTPHDFRPTGRSATRHLEVLIAGLDRVFAALAAETGGRHKKLDIRLVVRDYIKAREPDLSEAEVLLLVDEVLKGARA